MSAACVAQTAGVTFELGGYRADSGVTVRREAPGLRVLWPSAEGEIAEIVFNLELGPNRPLIERFAIGEAAAGEGGMRALMQGVDPVTLLTIGERDLKTPSAWVAFFDNPPLRAYRTVPAVLAKKTVRVGEPRFADRRQHR